MSAPFVASTPAAAQRHEQALTFLRGAFAGEPRPAVEVEAEARALGISHSTLQRARDALGIVSRRQGVIWFWVPPVAAARGRQS
jgi:hypothetical protein